MANGRWEGEVLMQATHSRSTKVTDILLRIPDYTRGNGEPWKSFKQERNLEKEGSDQR